MSRRIAHVARCVDDGVVQQLGLVEALHQTGNLSEGMPVLHGKRRPRGWISPASALSRRITVRHLEVHVFRQSQRQGRTRQISQVNGHEARQVAVQRAGDEIEMQLGNHLVIALSAAERVNLREGRRIGTRQRRAAERPRLQPLLDLAQCRLVLFELLSLAGWGAAAQSGQVAAQQVEHAPSGETSLLERPPFQSAQRLSEQLVEERRRIDELRQRGATAGVTQVEAKAGIVAADADHE